MKALTIKQPWATLVALGEKKIETRSWATKYRGELYIHAGMKIDKKMCEEFDFIDIGKLETGAIIAKCDLIDCRKIIKKYRFHAVVDGISDVRGFEFAFGDYTEGRYAWILNNIQPLIPIQCKGKLSLWNCTSIVGGKVI